MVYANLTRGMEGSKLKWAFSKSKDNSPCHVLLKFYYSILYHHVVDVDEILYKIENFLCFFYNCNIIEITGKNTNTVNPVLIGPPIKISFIYFFFF
jgi:hypothetical protein